MDSTSRTAFVRGYTKVLTNAWSDEAFMKRLTSKPTETLAEYGLDAGKASVEVVTAMAGAASLDDQISLWESGLASGQVKLYVPTIPQIDTKELSEDQLESVSGGDTYCCCCCPCCTCT
ncbi:MAG: hypothetical protein EBV58_00965 [Actinobacteria bacterium]|nr:hypothetical protein [Actinomycetota bacterium]